MRINYVLVAVSLTVPLTGQCMDAYDHANSISQAYEPQWHRLEQDDSMQNNRSLDSEHDFFPADEFYEELPEILDSIEWHFGPSSHDEASHSYSNEMHVPEHYCGASQKLQREAAPSQLDTHQKHLYSFLEPKNVDDMTPHDGAHQPFPNAQMQHTPTVKGVRKPRKRPGGRHRAAVYDTSEAQKSQESEWWKEYNSSETNYILDRLSEVWGYNKNKANRASARKRFKYHLNPKDTDIVLYGTPDEATEIAMKWPMSDTVGPPWFMLLDEQVQDDLMKRYCFYHNFTPRNARSFFHNFESLHEAEKAISDIERELIERNKSELLWKNPQEKYRADETMEQPDQIEYTWQTKLPIADRKMIYQKLYSMMPRVPFEKVKKKVDGSNIMTYELAKSILAKDKEVIDLVFASIRKQC